MIQHWEAIGMHPRRPGPRLMRRQVIPAVAIEAEAIRLEARMAREAVAGADLLARREREYARLERQADRAADAAGFRARLRETRVLLGITQSELGRMSGICPSSISTYEVGRARPRLEAMHQIALALRVNESWLLHGVGSRGWEPVRIPVRRAGEPAAQAAD